MSKSCRMCGEILSNMTCPHCGSHIGICDGCDHTEPCRAVPAATWSQEPPTEAGWYWFVGTLTMIDDDGHILDHARCSRPNAVFVRADGYVNYDGMPWSASGSDGWWQPATVPQPPTGEVKP